MTASNEMPDAMSKLTLLRLEAIGLADDFPWAAEVLNRSATVEPSGEDCKAGPPPTQQLPSMQYGREPAYEKVIQLLQDLKIARQEAYNAKLRQSVSRRRNTVNTLD
jgi:hypothetical protein